MAKPWLPKSIESLRGYRAADALHDLVAGVTVGLVALPLAMAFAISSGMPPQAGIYGAIVAGFLISALGGSRTQIGGPTGAFVVVVAGIVAQHGVEGLFICTFLAGLILVLLGATGLGVAVDYIPRPVVVGFTNGIAILIASTQLRDFFGLRVEHASGAFLPRLRELWEARSTGTLEALLVAVASLALVLLVPRFFRRVPGAIVALVGGTAAVAWLAVPVETIGSRFGGIPSGLPSFHVPALRLEAVPALLSPALTIAMLGAIESLMSAVVADRMTGDRHNPNVELVAQGVANLASPLVGGLPATGAIARTATNIRSGARTPIAGMIHAVTLLGVLLAAAPLAKWVPLPTLAAILLVVAYNMGDWAEIPEILKLSKGDIAVWMITVSLTVFADLSLAVQVGMILAGLLFIRKVAVTTTVEEVTDEELAGSRVHVLHGRAIPEYVALFRIQGPLLFGAAEKIRDIYENMDDLPPIVIVRLRWMTAIDATGLTALRELAQRLRERRRELILCGAREQPARLMRQAEFDRQIGPENLCANIEEGLARAAALHQAHLREARSVAAPSSPAGGQD
jgi:SulP family sulfate permease